MHNFSMQRIFEVVFKRKQITHETALSIVKEDGMSLQKLSSTFRDNGEIVSKATVQNARSLQFASGRLKDDETFIKQLIDHDLSIFQFASERIRSNKSLILNELIEKNASIVQYISDTLRTDMQFMMDCTKKEFDLICYAWEYERDDDGFTCVDLHADLLTVFYAHPSLYNNKEYARFVLQRNGKMLKVFTEDITNDVEMIKNAVLSYKDAFQFACNKQSNNIELVKYVVNLHSPNIRYASEEIRDNEELMKEFITWNAKAFNFASERLRGKKSLAKLAIKKAGCCIRNASKELQNDKRLLKLAVKSAPSCVKIFSDELFDDFDFIYSIVTSAEGVFEYLPKKCKCNKMLTLAAVSKDGNAFQFVDCQFFEDEEVIRAAITKNGYSLEYVPRKFRTREIVKIALQTAEIIRLTKFTGDKELALISAERFGYFGRKYLSKRLLKDIEIACVAVKNDSFYMNNSYEEDLYDNREFMMAAVSTFSAHLSKASPRLLNDKSIVSLAIEKNPLSYECLPRDSPFRTDDEIIMIIASSRNAEETIKRLSIPVYLIKRARDLQQKTNYSVKSARK